MKNSEVLAKEEEFHDEWANSIDIHQVMVKETFELPTSPESKQIYDWLGDITNKELLDLGSGAGESAVYFATKNAKVTATDLSGGMLNIVQQVASLHDTKLNTVKCSADELPFEEGSFDIVHGANLLHHVDLEKTIKEAHRVLRPGGVAVFWDPLIHNPIINIYRRIATKVRTEDETPLSIGDLRTFKQTYSEVKYECFWFFTLFIFIKFYLFDRIDPNKVRYWKKILTDYEEFKSTYNILFKLDRVCLKLFPCMRKTKSLFILTL